MIERLIHQALTTGIAALTADPDRLEDIFQNQHGLSAEETASIREFFLTDPPSVIHGYARPDSKFPLYAITLGSENVVENFLGNEGGFIDDGDDEDFGADYTAQMWSTAFNVLIYAQHPDVALYYYQLAKLFLVGNIAAFTACGLYDVKFSGADMAPDPAWVPAGLFLRRFTMTAAEEYQQLVPSSKLGKAFRVAGIHIDANGAQGESVGGVKTLVTVEN